MRGKTLCHNLERDRLASTRRSRNKSVTVGIFKVEFNSFVTESEKNCVPVSHLQSFFTGLSLLSAADATCS